MNVPTRNFVLTMGLLIVLVLVTGCGHGGGGGAAVYILPRPTNTPTPTPTVIPTYYPTPTPTIIPTYYPTPTPTVVPTPTPTVFPTPTPTPTIIPTPTPTPTFPAFPLFDLGLVPNTVTRDSVTFRVTIGDFDPYMSIIFTPSDTNPTYEHTSMIAGFQYVPYNPVPALINWLGSNQVAFPGPRIGLMTGQVQGLLTPNTRYSYRAFMLINEIRFKSTHTTYLPLQTYTTDIFDFTTSP